MIQLNLMFLSLESTEAEHRESSRGEACVAPDSNNNNNAGVDFNQQYREWKEMMVAATAARDRAEQEKQVRKQFGKHARDALLQPCMHCSALYVHMYESNL